jgi:O-antigen/teichoic acid export membrane protein
MANTLKHKKVKKDDAMFKNVLGISIFKALGVLTNFLLVGVIYRYFSNEELNGIWLTVFSIITWLTIFDFGMGNGLRNRLTESLSSGNIELAKRYISTTYILMIIPTLCIIIFSLIFIPLINWVDLFNVNNILLTNEYLSLFVLIIVLLYSINFYLSIIFAVLHATFQSYKVPMIHFYVNICNVLFVLLTYLFTNINDLIILGTIYIGSSIVVLLYSTINIFNSYKINICPKFNYFEKSLVRDIFGLGINFLVLQLAIIVLFNTDNLLISKYIGVSEVTGYQLTYKMLSIFTIVLSIILTPIWTLIIKLNTDGAYRQIKNAFKKVIFIYLLLCLGVFITGFFIPSIINLWVGSNVSSVSNSLISYMVVFTLLHMWTNIYQSILNGLNKLYIQVISFGAATIINIPVSIFLVQNTDLGTTAIIAGTIISLLIPSTILPAYLYTVLKKKI